MALPPMHSILHSILLTSAEGGLTAKTGPGAIIIINNVIQCNFYQTRTALIAKKPIIVWSRKSDVDDESSQPQPTPPILEP